MMSGIFASQPTDANHKPKRILLLRTDGSIGDFVLFSSALREYRELFPGIKITLLVASQVMELAQHCPYVDEVWDINIRKFRANPIEHWLWFKRLRSERFDLAINTVYSTTGGFVDCLAGWTDAPRRIAFECLDRIRPRRSPKPYFTEIVPTKDEWRFEGERNLEMLRYLGYKNSVKPFATELWIDAHASDSAEKLLGRLKGQSYGILFPGAGRSIRLWPVEHFVDVINIHRRMQPLEWIICGAKKDSSVCNSAETMLKGQGVDVLNLCGKTSQGEFASLIAGAQVCLSNDTGAVHIAAAAGTPVVFILGGGEFGRFLPYPSNPLAVGVINELPCYFCYWRCIRDEVECITKVTVEQVVAALTTLFERTMHLNRAEPSRKRNPQ